MFYQFRHFRPEEVLPPTMFHAHGALGLLVMDSRILWTLDAIRDFFGVPVTVNTWLDGGQQSQRGFRDDPGVGAALSQHRYGRAADFDIQGVTAAEFRELAKSGALGGPGHPESVLQYVTRIEETNGGNPIGWIHTDCANVDTRAGIQFIQA